MANNHIKLDKMLIRSYTHFRSFKLNAYFKSIEDLNFDGLPNNYVNNSMTRMQGSRYPTYGLNYRTFDRESYWLDIETMKAERVEVSIRHTANCFVEGEYMLVVKYGKPIAILRDLQEIGQIEFSAKHETCKNNKPIGGRHSQQAGHSVYVISNDACLYSIEWQDVKNGKYVKTLVKENVRRFFVDRRLGLAIVNKDDTLKLPSLNEVDLKAKVDSYAAWTIVSCIAKFWIVSGHLDSDGHTIMASISDKGNIKSTLKLKLTSNGYKNRDGREFAGIFTLQNVFIRGRRGIMLAIERDGCCHLISVAYGRMSKMQSIDSIVNVVVVEEDFQRIVMCVSATGKKDEFIAGGDNWTRRISLKLK